MNLFPSFVIDKRRFYSKNSTHLFLILPASGSPRVRLNTNKIQLLLIGLCLGVTLGVALFPLFDYDCNLPESHNLEHVFIKLQDQSNSIRKDPYTANSSQTKPVKMLRPRFYSTELGLRKQIVAGIILTNYSKLENLVAINKTISTFVDQLLFFVVGHEASQQVRSLGLPGVVTLAARNSLSSTSTSTTSSLKPLHLSPSETSGVGLKALKYLGEKALDSYNYFYLASDRYYRNGDVLKRILATVSVSQELLWGFENERDKCSIDTGFLFSHAILRKLRQRVDRCNQSPTLQSGDSISNCLRFALNSQRCSFPFDTFPLQPLQYPIYPSMTFDEEPDKLINGVCIGPVYEAKEMYKIHEIIQRKQLKRIRQETKIVQSEIQQEMPHLPDLFKTDSWPTGVPESHIARSRFDIITWKFFTSSRICPYDDLIPDSHLLPEIDALDLQRVINTSLQDLAQQEKHQHIPLVVSAKELENIFHLDYGFRRFDETRGMDYILNFKDVLGKPHIVECIRPLSKTELLSVPFVTENRRVTIVIPVYRTDQDTFDQAQSFLRNYLSSPEKVPNSVIVLAIILQSPVQDPEFIRFKRMVATVSHSSNSTDPTVRAGHVIVNLKQFKSVPHPIFAVFDMLSNQILNENALVLCSDLFPDISNEFLNRVRMNTIIGHQLFSPIPFQQYSPAISGISSQILDIHKTTGYFDPDNCNFLSFIVRDYKEARKTYIGTESKYKLNFEEDLGVRSLSEFFLAVSNLHFLRGPEPSLIIKFNLSRRCLKETEECLMSSKWGSKSQLAKFILANKSLNISRT